jgi:hypothetical protein
MPTGSIETNYDEPKKGAPAHRLPKGVEVDLRRHPQAGARIAIERLAASLVGIDDGAFRRVGFSKRDLVEHREEILSALSHVIKEVPNPRQPRLRGASIAYLGELRYREAIDVLGGLATGYDEAPAIRGLAVEALCRIGGDECAELLVRTLDDPDAAVRERGAKALGIIGRERDGDVLAGLAAADPDPTVRDAANAGARNLLPREAHARLAKEAGKPRNRRSSYSEEEASIVRPIGRDERRVQPDHRGADGGIDHVTTARFGSFEVGLVSASPTYAIEQPPVSGRSRLRVVGADRRSGLGASTVGAEAGIAPPVEDRFQPPTVVDRVIEGERLVLRPGRRIGSVDGADRADLRDLTYVPNLDASPVITGLGPNVPTVWKGEGFAVEVDFQSPGRQVPVWLKLEIQLPAGRWHERWFAVSKAQQAAGRVVVRGFRAAQSGRMRLAATLYGSGGGTAVARSQHVVFTPNPHSVSIVPQTTGTNGEGPAHYNGADDRFFCHATCTFTNGHSFPLTVGPTVTCTVTDGGSHVATFDFSIGTRTVAAQSSLVLGIFTSHGSSSGVYDVFADFGDVTMDFAIQTSQGLVSDSNVWAAMARIDLALNFVGNMSAATRSTFQSVVENEASAVFEQQSLYIPNTQRFLLPSGHPDWGRYRDIEMDDNKASDCTAGSDEADDLRDDWSSPTDLLDVWVVESFSGPACAANVGGFSPVDGPTGKGGSRSGLLVQLAGINLSTQSGRDLMGIVVAHEVAHFLGLDHSTTNDNFMEASVGTSNTDITHGQYLDMADHGFVDRFVP